MENKSKELLEAEIERELKEISTLPLGDDYMGGAIVDLATLYRLKIDEEKLEAETKDRGQRQELEESKLGAEREDKYRRYKLEEERVGNESQQMAEQKKDRYIKIGIEVAGIIVPIIFYSRWMRQGFRFEETGAFTSTTFRNLFHNFKPTKK